MLKENIEFHSRLLGGFARGGFTVAGSEPNKNKYKITYLIC